MAHRGRATFIAMVIACPTLAFPQSGGDVRIELTRDYLVSVRGKVDDRSGLTFVVDTGTLPTLVDARIATQFRKAGPFDSLRSSSTAPLAQGRPKVPVDSFAGSAELESAVLTSLAVGSFSALDVPVLVTDLARLEPHFGIKADVVLGVEVLRGTCFSIDYIRRRLSFSCRDDWRATVPLDRGSSLVVANVTIDGTPLRLRVDTGSPAVVVYDNVIPDGWRSRVQSEINAFDFSGPVRLRRFIADAIAVGPMTFHRRPVHILPADVVRQAYHGVLGVRALGVSAVQFDLGRMTLSWND